jgi:beta-glucosidase
MGVTSPSYRPRRIRPRSDDKEKFGGEPDLSLRQNDTNTGQGATVGVMKPICVVVVVAPILFGCSSKSASGTGGSSGTGGNSGTGGISATGGTSGTGGIPGSGGLTVAPGGQGVGPGGQGVGSGGAGGPAMGGAPSACNTPAANTAWPGLGGAPACQSNPADYANPFLDPCRPIEERITNLLALLTFPEKQSLLASNHPAIPRLGLPPAPLGTEGLHGVALSADPANITTQYPQAFGLGEAWDPAVTRAVGETIGHETRVYNARGVNPTTGRLIGIVVRAPNVDLARDPRWGRTEESYGEDPYLIGELAKTFVSGLQGSDPKYLQVASLLKHFMANSNENTRVTSSSNLDARDLREFYAATFETAIRGAHAQGMMTAYNKLNGVPAAVSPLLKSMVIGEWGFDGIICTDGGAPGLLVPPTQTYFPTVEQSVAAIIKAGTGTLLQGSTAMPLATTLTNAVAMGLFTQADADAVLRPVLRVRFRLGDFDPPSLVPYKRILGTETPWNTPEAKASVLDVTHKTIVLLKNANRTLPLDRAAIRSVALIGPRADSVLRDWYGGTAPYLVTPRQGIANKLGTGTTVRYALDNTANAATTAAAMSDVAIVFVGNHPTCGDAPFPPWGTCPSQYEGREAVDRVRITLEPAQLTLVQSVAAANPRTIVVLVSSFPVGIGPVDANANVPAIVHVANSSQELGNAVADVLFGDFNPGGHTTMTWYQTEADIPTALTDYDIRKGTTYWYFTGTPLYPFGYGLSYSTFAYSNLTVSAPSVSVSPAPGSCAAVQVGVDIANTSAVAGDEVVQLYVAYPGSTVVPRPRQQLRGFRRVNIAAGATAHVTFNVAAADLGYFDAATARFTIETGKMVELQVGASSRDIRLRGMLAVAP